jgi:hypothetical protein
VDLIKHVLKHCEHVSCHPTRLIEVTQVSTGTRTIRFRYSKLLGQPDGVKYTALSHRWRELTINTLRSSNIQHFEKGFDIGNLPKTFQETMILTSSLGVGYIWIDSRCIIQDSRVD